MSSEVTVFSDSDWAVKSRVRGTTPFESVHRRSLAGQYVAALGTLEAKGVQSMMCNLGPAVKPVIIDVKATEHILHRHGIGKMKHFDVAHLWLQDEVKSNRLRVRRVKSEENLSDIGAKALSNKLIKKRATSTVCIDAQQLDRKRLGNQLVAMPDSSSGSEGSQVSPRVTKRGNSKPDASPFCGPFPRKRIVMDSDVSSHVDFLTNGFEASTKLCVDDGIVVVAAEDDASASLISDISMVQ